MIYYVCSLAGCYLTESLLFPSQHPYSLLDKHTEATISPHPPLLFLHDLHYISTLLLYLRRAEAGVHGKVESTEAGEHYYYLPTNGRPANNHSHSKPGANSQVRGHGITLAINQEQIHRHGVLHAAFRPLL